ncbi:MAG: hypothetical protein V8S87_06415 [Oscillospiraceae bacterium]
MEELRNKKGFIFDMDGVIYHGNRLLPGVKEFVDWLYRENKQFLFLTNSSERTPKELQQKLGGWGWMLTKAIFTPAPRQPRALLPPSGSRMQRLCRRRQALCLPCTMRASP